MPVTQVTLGGTTYDIPEVLPFSVLKRAKPALAEWLNLSGRLDQQLAIVDQVSLAIRVIVAALVDKHPTLTAENVEATITRDEWLPLVKSIGDIMRASGIIRTIPPGEAPAPEDPAQASTT